VCVEISEKLRGGLHPSEGGLFIIMKRKRRRGLRGGKGTEEEEGGVSLEVLDQQMSQATEMVPLSLHVYVSMSMSMSVY